MVEDGHQGCRQECVMMLIQGKQLNELTPCKQCYAVVLQLFIVVLNTLK